MSRSLVPLFLGLILVLSTLAVMPVAPANAGTAGTITVSSDRFYGAAPHEGEALLQITISDPDIAGSDAAMPYVEAIIGGVHHTLDLYQIVGGSWVCWITCTGSTVTPANPPSGVQFPVTGKTTPNDYINYILDKTNDKGSTIDIVYHDSDPSEDIKVTVTYDTTDATISLDRTEYPVNAIVKVEINDPDLNWDPTSKDTAADLVELTTTSDTTPHKATLTESGPTTNIFKGSIDMAGVNEAVLDVITVIYTPDDKAAYAKVTSYTGQISLDKDEYMVSDKAVVTVIDPDLNLDSGDAESYAGADSPVTVKSEDDTAGRAVKITETGDNTGIFEGKFKFSFTAGADGDEPVLYVGDSGPQDITAEYADASLGKTLSATASFITHTGTISLDRDTYGPGMKAVVTVTDPDLNTSPSSPQRYDNEDLVVVVKSTADSTGTGITILETEVNSGVFEGKFKFNPGKPTEEGDVPKISVNPTGDTVTVEYADKFDSGGSAKTVKAEARYKTNTGSIAFAKTSYAPGQKVQIILTDPDLNLDIYTQEYVDVNYNAGTGYWELYVSSTAGGLDTAIKTDYTSPPVFIYSSSWSTGWPTTTTGVISLKESDINTGVFKLTAPDTLSELSGGAVRIGDTLYVKYIDAANDVGSVATLTGSAGVRTNTAILEVDKTEAKIGEKVKVTLTDPDKNIDPGAKDTVDVTLKSSKETDTLTLTETDKDTGVFEEEFTVKKETTGSGDEKLQVAKGETIEVKYTDDYGAGGATNIKMSKTVTIYSSDGSVSFDKDTYSPVGKVKITIEDPDCNEDSDSRETIDASRIRVYSTTDPSGINVSAEETDIDTGVFTVEITLIVKGSSDAAAKELRVSNGDSIVVAYTEEADSTGATDVLRMDSASVWYTTATLAFDKDTYTMDETATVTLTEPDKNVNPSLKETVNITVYSTSDPAGIVLSLLETENNSGVFQGSLTFTTGASTGSILKAIQGDTITAVYTDETPYEYPSIEFKRVTATATIGVAVPGLPIVAGTPALTDPTTGEPVETPSVGKAVMVSTELSNVSTLDQTMLYIVQIKDAAGKVVYMSYISGTVPGAKSFTFGVQWVPPAAGDYTIEVFAWKSWAEPTPLSEMASQAVTVS